MNDRISSKIPNLYHSFFPDFIHKPIPGEKIATCNNCTLKMPKKSVFANTKCCVYYAELPNYLIGGLLKDARPSLQEGKKIALELISKKVGISPYGIRKPVWYKSYEKEFSKKTLKTFSKEESEMLLCPFYGKEGNCTTWAYREHCCSTFFCFSVGGDDGEKFWSETDTFLHQVEKLLAQYAAKKLGFEISIDDKSLDGNLFNADDKDVKVDQKKYEQIWSGINQSEEDFYRNCHSIIESLSKEEFKAILGDYFDQSTEKIEGLIEKFNNNIIPDFLIWNKQTEIKHVSDFIVELSTPKGSRKVKINKLPILQLFDGKKSTADIAHLAFKAKASFSNDISKLLEIGVLNNYE